MNTPADDYYERLIKLAVALENIRIDIAVKQSQNQAIQNPSVPDAAVGGGEIFESK
ncbi:hypothetical protein [Gloeobacter morelensis]|uniref:Uncharacterized protein n=1 Tax=Gloeobacter morelensis MG652769 TaxID=2781736 RepID=A0ABY3PM64_9CYAN|nr:hypothetical protein [Gloeobacter morelensis]UFP94737.1 hypothetical protein ISF26_00315 [Gloeobacter morelensis MG652769]